MAKNKKREKVTPKELKGFSQKVRKNMIIEIMRENLGNIYNTCEMMGITRPTFYNYYKKDAEFKAQIDEIKEIKLDITEAMLNKCVLEGSEKSIFYTLNNLGGSRGYHPPNYTPPEAPGDPKNNSVLAKLSEFQQIQNKFKAENK